MRILHGQTEITIDSLEFKTILTSSLGFQNFKLAVCVLLNNNKKNITTRNGQLQILLQIGQGCLLEFDTYGIKQGQQQCPAMTNFREYVFKGKLISN